MGSLVIHLGPDGSWGTYSLPRLLGLALFFSASVTTALIGVTGAIFTDTETVGANTFTAGTIDISALPASAVVSFSDMAPGDESVGAVTVTNNGSLELRYSVTSTTTEDTLAAQLDMTIKVAVSTCTTAGFDVDGVVLYGPSDLGSVAGLNVIGDPAPGVQGGERVQGASDFEALCIRVSLPIATGNAFQGLTTTATLNFSAEQTANN
ncbi:MAG: hypothetical protein IH961_08345 [Chloroflexi bacterium]|nr:hypothetical protein [Chloroflexota bacterium]